MRVRIWLASLLFTGTIAWGQSTSGSVSGSVSDSSGALLPGVKVRATSPALIEPQTVRTSESGTYRFPALSPGIYHLTFEASGFAVLERDGLTVSLGVADTINVTLGLASQSQAVQVTGEGPLVDVQNTNRLTVIDSQQLKNLPNSRDIWSLLAESPGIQVTRFDVGGSTAGTQTGYSAYGLRDQNRVTVDGANTTEGTGAAGYYFDYGAFEEFTVSTGANDASMPTPGVQVNAILKSGGNHFHGDLYFDYENGSFQGHNISTSQLQKGSGIGTRIDHYYDPNGNIGGPIKRDKLWFFVSLRNQEIGNTVTGFPVEKPGSVIFLTKLQNITYKLSSQLNANNKISHYLQWGRKTQPFRAAASNTYLDAVQKQNSFSWSGNVQWDSTISPKFFLVSRFATFAYNWPNNAYPGADGQIDTRRVENATGNIAGGYDPYRYNRRRYQGEVNGNYYLDNFLKVSHNLKFGWTSEREWLGYEQYGWKGDYRLYFNSPAGSPDFTTPYQVGITNEPALQSEYTWHHGFFLQDQIRVNRHLVINAGVRLDHYHGYEPDQKIRPDAIFRDFFYGGAPIQTSAGPYTIPASFTDFTVKGRDVVRFPHAITPRLGVAWDLSGTGKTVIKLNWGQFYSSPATALGSDTNPIQKTEYIFGWNDLNHDKQFQPNEFGAFATSNGGSNFRVGSNFRAPRTDDAEVFIERQIGQDFVLRAGFVYKKVNHDWQLVEVGRAGSLYTQKKYFCDPGVTGLNNCADGQGIQPIYDIPAGAPVPASQGIYQTPDANTRDYKNLEVALSKRLSRRFTFQSSYFVTWENTVINTNINTGLGLPAFEFGYVNGIPTNPNEAVNNRASFETWSAKATGSYYAKGGFVISPILRGQSGQPQARIVNVTSAALTPGGPTTALRAGSYPFVVEPWGTYRQDNVWLFDTRVEKTLKFSESKQLGLFVDAFNMLNTNADQTQDNITGRRTALVNGTSYNYQRFLRPTNVVGPRIFRLGAKFSF